EPTSAHEEVAVRRVVQPELEAERPDARSQLRRRPAPLDDPERTAVRQGARLLPGFLVGSRVRGVAGAAVDEDDAPARHERRAHEATELVEPLLRDVREPEGEEHEIEAPGRPPPEDVGADELGVARVENERLGVRVDGDDAIRPADELPRPDPRAGGE